MPQAFEITHEIDRLANLVIEEFHPHLKDARISYLYRTGRWESKGRVEIGRALVAPAPWKALTGYDVLIVVNKEVYHNYDEKGRIAQLDHIFSFISKAKFYSNGQASYQTANPDIYEFSAVVLRHNVFFSNLDALDVNGRQLSLDPQYKDLAICANNEAGPPPAEVGEELAGAEIIEPLCTLEEGDGSSPDDVAVIKSFDF